MAGRDGPAALEQPGLTGMQSNDLVKVSERSGQRVLHEFTESCGFQLMNEAHTIQSGFRVFDGNCGELLECESIFSQSTGDPPSLRGNSTR